MSLHREKKVLILINLFAGGSVIASYIQGLMAHPGKSNLLWGNVPLGLLPFYTASMAAAAAGYLIFTSHLIFFIDPDRSKISGRFPFRLFNWLYLIILLFSALWMPLTFIMLEKPSALLWLAIRCILASAGLGSIGLLAAMFRLQPSGVPFMHRTALLGGILFAFQTAILDALVWTAYFPYKW
jgi:hypothetical protein